MFKEDTVFILGAGASWHYGYPTGEELVKRVIQKCNKFSKTLHECAQHHNVPLNLQEYVRVNGFASYTDIAAKAKIYRDLAERLEQTNTLIIDTFLSQQNEDIQEAGKMMIAWEILDCEKAYFQGVNVHKNNNFNINRLEIPEIKYKNYKDDWYRFLIHKLVSECPKGALTKNKVSFVTFNYDVSLEQALIRALKAMPDYFDQQEIKDFLSSDRIIHVYGQVRKEQENLSYYSEIQTDFTDQKGPDFLKIESASSSIRTIEDIDKGNGNDLFKKIRARIKKAKNVYILGYGFNETNSKRIGIDKVKNFGTEYGQSKKIYITNKDNRNTINKAVNWQLINESYEGNFIEKHIIDCRDDEGSGHFFEKSIKSVYEALEEDFGLL